MPAPKWTTVKKKIADLQPHPKNPRQMTEKQNSDLEKSLEKFGVATTPVINKDGTILGGHQRIRVLAAEGVKEVDVRIPSRMLKEDESDELLLRLNRNHGQWDFDKLANEFEVDDLKDWGFEDNQLGIFGDDVELDEFFSEPEEKPEAKESKHTITLDLTEEQYTEAMEQIKDRGETAEEIFMGAL